IMAIFLPVAFMSGTIGRFFFQFGVTVGVAVFLSLLCALTLTPMLCGFFLNVRSATQRWPRPRRWELGIVVGVLLALFMSGLRGFGHFAPAVANYGWPVRGFHAPLTAVGTWWAIEVFAEVAAGFLLTVYGGIFYRALDRFLLTPLLIRPTETLLNLLTRAYTR